MESAVHVRSLTYLEHDPGPPLNQYIDCFYYVEGSMAIAHEKILPLPVLDLKINLGGPLQVREVTSAGTCQAFHDSWWVGLYTVSHALVWPRDLRLYGVRIKPAGAYPLLGLPLSELHNRVISLEELWKGLAGELRERLAAAPSTDYGFRILEWVFCNRLAEDPWGLDLVHYAVSEMEYNRGI